VAERHIVRLTIGGGERDADDSRTERARLIGYHSEAEFAGGAKPGCQRVEVLERDDEPVVLLDGVGRRRVVVHERAERQSGEELVAALA
jgi:hypothetical protein